MADDLLVHRTSESVSARRTFAPAPADLLPLAGTGTCIITSVSSGEDTTALSGADLSRFVETKNVWARDDPAMLLLISGCLSGASAFSPLPPREKLTAVSTVAAVLWSVIYAHYGIALTLRTMFVMVVVEFFGVGLVISTALWYVKPSIVSMKELTTFAGRCPTNSLRTRRIRTQQINALNGSSSCVVLKLRDS